MYYIVYLHYSYNYIHYIESTNLTIQLYRPYCSHFCGCCCHHCRCCCPCFSYCTKLISWHVAISLCKNISGAYYPSFSFITKQCQYGHAEHAIAFTMWLLQFSTEIQEWSNNLRILNAMEEAEGSFDWFHR